jgi:hypothetical protein
MGRRKNAVTELMTTNFVRGKQMTKQHAYPLELAVILSKQRRPDDGTGGVQ